MKKALVFTALICLLSGIFIGTRLYADVETYPSIRVFTRILKDIEDNYVLDISSDSLLEGAINGMIEKLNDPHTDYLSKEEYDALMLTIKGEYGGIGAYIGRRNEKITVISPFEGTPAQRAGILPGDVILKVDGVSTEGKSVDVVVKEIKGTPGTGVVLTIERQSIKDPFAVELIRAIVKLDAVPYFGLVNKDIGYVQLADFSRTADDELERALDSLFAMGAKKIVFDLRLNGGGLLNEGVTVSELFLAKDQEIVVTRGRVEKEKVFRAQKSYTWGDFPMVTLIDAGSASASEIVAGALQDWERSLIIGTNSFGKGSAQKIYQLENGGALKLTTDRWYTPSGRSIDRGFGKTPSDANDTTTVKERTPFTTLGPLKRTMYGDGGITPDVVIEPQTMTKLELDILTKGLDFDYVVKYTTEHKDLDQSFKVSDAMMRDFAVFLMSKDLEFNEEQFDSIKIDFKKRLEQDLFSILWGLKEGYRIRVVNDPVVRKAIEILKEASTTQDLFSFMDKLGCLWHCPQGSRDPLAFRMEFFASHPNQSNTDREKVRYIKRI